MKKPYRQIRFGVICDTSSLNTWQDIVQRKLAAQADVDFKLSIFIRNGREATQQGILHGSPHGQASFWNLYYGHWIKKRSVALKEVEANAIFTDVPQIYCNLIEGDEGTAQLENLDIARIKDTGLDFIVDFTSMRFRGNVLYSASHGIWSFRFGGLGKNRTSVPCFWEIYLEEAITSAYLVRLTEECGAAVVLKEGHLKTSISYPKNIDKIHSECASWPLKICQDIRNKNTDYFTFSSKIKEDKCRFPPDNMQLLIFFLIQIKLLVRKVCKMLFYVDYWNIGVANAQIHEFLDPQKKPSVKWFANLPKTRFMADPFGIKFKGKLYVLYEDFRFDQGIGKTASFLFHEGSFVENNIVIDEKFHMSYPFLLEYEDEVYCIPETYQANQVRLYKAVEFPNEWILEKVLIDNYAGIDSTLFKYNGTWFLFSTNINSGHRYNLNIHWSESLFGPWQCHPKNPVKTDIRSARPAGTLFEHNGAVYRPSMDYSQKVEGRIVINKILTLTTKDFKEEAHTIIDPFKNIYFSDKVHTLSQVGSHTLVDGAKELFIFSNFHAFRYKVKKALAELKK